MHAEKKYKSDFKKYYKSEVGKCESISFNIKQSDRADLVNCVLILISS